MAASLLGAATTGTPGFMMPAFSKAIFSTVSPRMDTWSRLMEVIAQTSGRTMLVESSLPPSPTSITWKSAPMLAKWTNAIAVSASKVVAGP